MWHLGKLVLVWTFIFLLGCASQSGIEAGDGSNLNEDEEQFVEFVPPDGVALCELPEIPMEADNQGAILIDSCTTLDQEGATYLLNQDLQTEGSCLRISADNITLDLGGHRILYGTALTTDYLDGTYGEDFACSVAGVSGTAVANLEIRNGTIEQGDAENPKGHPLHFRGLHGARIHNLRVIGKSTDTCTFHFMYSDDLEIFENHLSSYVTEVTDRHYPGQSVIRLASGETSNEVHDNVIDSGPHWGIMLSKEPAEDLIYQNCFSGMRSRFANGYAIGAHTDGAQIYDNYINTESRGIHVTAEGVTVRNNYVEVWERPNEEYTDYFTHGIKMEGATHSRVFQNEVISKSDSEHGGAYALDLTLRTDSANEIFQNIFEARSLDESHDASAINLIAVEEGNDSEIHHNTFKGDHYIYRISWNGANDLLIRDSIFEKTGSRSDFRTLTVAPGSDYPSHGNALWNIETVNGADLADIWKWHNSAFDLSIGWSLDTIVQNASGDFVEGAGVKVDDGQNIREGETNADGQFSTTVTEVKLYGDATDGNDVQEERQDISIQASRNGEGFAETEISVDEPTEVTLTLE